MAGVHIKKKNLDTKTDNEGKDGGDAAPSQETPASKPQKLRERHGTDFPL